MHKSKCCSGKKLKLAIDLEFGLGMRRLKRLGLVRLTCVVAKADVRHTPIEQIESVVN